MVTGVRLTHLQVDALPGLHNGSIEETRPRSVNVVGHLGEWSSDAGSTAVWYAVHGEWDQIPCAVYRQGNKFGISSPVLAPKTGVVMLPRRG